MKIKKYIYRVEEATDLHSLNLWGSEGWLVIDRHYGKSLLAKEIEE